MISEENQPPLSIKKCVPCTGAEDPLAQAEIELYLQQVPAWKLLHEPDRIARTIQTQDFMDAVTQIQNIARLAEQEGHHPNIAIKNYNQLTIELFTHKIMGLHVNDFILATKIDQALNPDTID